MQKLAIITTHPVQYYAPVFKLLAERQNISIKVFYTWGEGAVDKFDPGFGETVLWDIPILEGYPYTWVKNTSTRPGSHHFRGIINPDLINDIKQWRPDALLVFGWAYQSHLKAIRFFKGKIPVFFRGDSTMLDQQTKIKSFFRTLLLKWVYKHVDTAFYVGKSNKTYYQSYGLRDDQLVFAPHAVDNHRFAENRQQEADQLRELLQINKNEILLLFAGKLEAKKSPHNLLEAFTQLNLPNTHLMFAGSGELSDMLHQMAAAHKNVHFMGFQNQSFMPVVYQASDIFCLPSKGPGETWGLAVNEAMACGKAIIASKKVGCAADLVQQTNGIIFESGNITELAAAIKTLAADKTRLAQMGERSAEIINAYTFLALASAIEARCI